MNLLYCTLRFIIVRLFARYRISVERPLQSGPSIHSLSLFLCTLSVKQTPGVSPRPVFASSVCVCVYVLLHVPLSLSLSALFSRHTRLWTNNVLFMAEIANTHEHRDASLQYVSDWTHLYSPFGVSILIVSSQSSLLGTF